MKINKLLGALGNLDKIAEGIKNKIFKRKEVEAIAKMRWAECKLCPLLDEKGKSCAVANTEPCCSDCGCSLTLKLRSLSSSCPKGRWGAVMDGKEENILVNQWLEKETEIHNEYLKARAEALDQTWEKKGIKKKKRGCRSCEKKKKK
jgi:hypothetical protein